MKWNFTTGWGVHYSPAIGSNGIIYFGSNDKNLYAVNQEGLEIWRFITGDVIHTSPIISADGTVYIASDDCKLYAVNPDGTEKWSYTIGYYCLHSSPAIGLDGTIYIGSYDNRLLAINPDGTLKWQFMAGDHVGSSPSIGEDGTIYVGSSDKKLYAISPDGVKKWSFTAGDKVTSGPSIGSDGTIYVGSEDYKLYAINPDGSLKWSFTTDYYVYSSPAISLDGTVYVISANSNLYAINSDGTMKWNYILGYTPGHAGSSPAIGSDGTIYAGSVDHKLYAIGATEYQPPTADAGPDQTVDEGDLVQFNGSASYDPDGTIETYEWDFTSDGTYDYQETSTNAPDGAFDGITEHIYGDDGVYTATLRVTDDGEESDTDLCDVTVNNVEPTLGTITAQGTTGESQVITEEWVARYDGPGNDYDHAQDIAVDSSGNVYVTGSSKGSGTGWDYSTIAYNSSGNVLWIARYNGPGNGDDYAVSIALGTSGNVYVTGQSLGIGTGWDYTTVAYDSIGNEVWVARYDGPSNYNDIAQDIAVDSSENVHVIGQSKGSGTDYDYATIKYDLDGNEQWVKRYNSPVNKSDKGNAIALDPAGNVYVTGKSDEDYATVAYDSSGNELWVARYNGPGNGPDWAWAIALDSSGYVYVTGQSLGSGTNNDYATIAYDSSGNELWVARYDGPKSTFDEASAIALDSSGNIYVTGASRGIGTNYDYATIAYDSSGNELWVARYNGPGNGPDWAEAIALDSSNNIYVTRSSDRGGIIADYATVAYDSLGTELWVARYNGPGNGDDYAYAIALDSSRNVYITGNSKGSGTEFDYCTIKYSSLTYYESKEGSSLSFKATATDPGSDDLSFTWDWGDGTIDTQTTYFNNGVNPEPVYNPSTNEVKSPSGTCPFSATDSESHTYGDDGVYTITLTIEDDDGGITTYTTNITVYNVAPIIDALPAVTINEFESVILTGHATDLGSDDLTFSWSWEYASWGDKTTIYYNDGTGPDPFPSPTINPRNVTEVATCQYGDDGIFKVTLTVVDDDGGSTTVMTNITVNNIAPMVTIKSVIMEVEIGLRVAGRKYNNVSMTVYEDGSPIGYISIERMPGSPDEQMAWIPVSIDFSKSYSATVTYTPEDPPIVGGNPVWIYIKSQNGSIKKIRHTFNVQQSKKRDSEHWNHVDPWEVDLNAHFIGLTFEITSHITDPGSDDEILTYTYSSQTVTVTYLNNPLNPDPYPSPEINPVDMSDTTTLIYEGPGTVTLVVKDDDNIRLGVGEGTDSKSVG
jgi:outer membrane protein assembly factor BamB